MTKIIMLQYETVRSSGICNMFDYNCVTNAAMRLNCYELAACSRKEYKDILMNFNKYMKKFGIKQN